MLSSKSKSLGEYSSLESNCFNGNIMCNRGFPIAMFDDLRPDLNAGLWGDLNSLKREFEGEFEPELRNTDANN